MQLALNFPAFFYAAVKNNTALDQYEAFNILFRGNTYINNGSRAISQTSASNFICGKRGITQDLLKDIFDTPHEEIVKRLRMLQLMDAEASAHSLWSPRA